MTQALKQRPWWVAVACIVAAACIIGIVFGVIAASNVEAQNRQTQSQQAADEKALNVKAVINGAFNPCITIATLINQDPLNWTSLNNTFYKVAPEIFSLAQSYSIFNVQLVPNSIIESIVPITGFQKAVGLDLLNQPARRPDTLKAIQSNLLTMAGPNM